jgi:PhnB protein
VTVLGGRLAPKLVVRGADAALDFYTRVFGARLTQRHAIGGHVVFAEMQVFGTPVQVKDEDDTDPSPTTLGRPGVLFDVTTEDPDALAAAVVDAGGSVVFPVADQPYGARGGRVRDPYGHEWLLQTPLTMSPAEVQQALDDAYGG